MERLGLLPVLLPELAALRGVPQAKALPGDALDHSLRTVDALPADRPLRMATCCCSDLGKATTLADGHFIGHEVEGARLAEQVVRRLRLPRTDAARIVRLVRQHMFAYTPDWTDAAVAGSSAAWIGPARPLRCAPPTTPPAAPRAAAGGIDELRARVAQVLASDALEQGQAGDRRRPGRRSRLAPGPPIGVRCWPLLDAVLDDPSQNTRERLLALARSWQSEPGASAHRQDGGAETSRGQTTDPLLQSAILGQCPPWPSDLATRRISTPGPPWAPCGAAGAPAATQRRLAELDAAVALAIEHDCAAITVNPWLVKAARRALGRERMRLGPSSATAAAARSWRSRPSRPARRWSRAPTRSTAC